MVSSTARRTDAPFGRSRRRTHARRSALHRRGETSLTRRVDRRPRRRFQTIRKLRHHPFATPRVALRRHRAFGRVREGGERGVGDGAKGRNLRNRGLFAAHTLGDGRKTRDRWTRRPPRDRSRRPVAAVAAAKRTNREVEVEPVRPIHVSVPAARSRARFPRRSLDAARRPPIVRNRTYRATPPRVAETASRPRRSPPRTLFEASARSPPETRKSPDSRSRSRRRASAPARPRSRASPPARGFANTRQPRANPSDLRLRRRLSSPSRRAVPHPPRRARPGARA